MTEPFPTMKWEDYHRQTISTAVYPDVGRGTMLAIMYCTVGLAGEVGSVANLVKKIARDDEGRVFPERVGAIGRQLGDAMWYLSRLIDELGLEPGEVLEINRAKLAQRAETDTIHGDGDERGEVAAGVPRGLCSECGKRYLAHLKIKPSHAFVAFPILPSPLAAQLFGQESPYFYSPEKTIGDGNTRYAVELHPEHGPFSGGKITRVFAIDGDHDAVAALCREKFGEATEIVSIEELES